MDGHTARKRFGQNFLADPHYIARIVDAVAPQPGDNLVEIGPGLAALTATADRARRTHRARSRSTATSPRGCAQRSRPTQLTLHVADALDFDFATLGPALRVVGNLPYNISSPLLFHLARYDDADRRPARDAAAGSRRADDRRTRRPPTTVGSP